MDRQEAISMLCIAILPTAILGLFVYIFGKPLDKEFMCVALLFFFGITILWLGVRLCKSKENIDDQTDLTDIVVREMDTKSPSATNPSPISAYSCSNPTPILAPIFSDPTVARTDLSPVGDLARAAIGYPPHCTRETGHPCHLCLLSAKKHQHEQVLPSYEVATSTDVPPPSYEDFMSIELST